MTKGSTLRILLAAMLLLFGNSVRTEFYGASPDQELSRNDLHALVRNAKTAADHRRLAAHFRGESARLLADQKEHVELARYYDEHPLNTKYPTPGDHCRQLAGYYGLAAKTAWELARNHEDLAVHAER